MPRKEIDYNQTIIYKIICKDLRVKELYVGHTTDFIRRKNNHKKNSTNEKSRDFNYNVYVMIRKYGGWENWDMIEIEKFPCLDGNEARARERHFYDTLSPTLNSIVPNRDMIEWRQQNKENIKIQRHSHYIENKEKILEKDKIYRTINAEKVKERRSQYYKENKELISERKKAKIYNCECGCIINCSYKEKHFKSQKHCKFIETKPNL